MDSVSAYLLSVTGAAIVCGCICALFPSKSKYHSLLKTLCGIFLTVTIIKPIINFQFTLPTGYWTDTSSLAENISQEGIQYAQHAQKDIIKQQTEAYILNKAKDLKCSICVEVVLQEVQPYAPRAVCIQGQISPYGKSQLTHWMETTLNIPAEDQTWIG